MVEDHGGEVAHETVKKLIPNCEQYSTLFVFNGKSWKYPAHFVVPTKAKTQSGMKNAPTPDEVHAYFTELGASGEASNFYDFYASKGWKVGAVAMKDWQAAARRWAKSNTKTKADDKLGNKLTRGKATDLIEQVKQIAGNS